VIIAQVVHPDVEAVYVQETRQIFAANQSFFQVTKQKLLTTMKSSGTPLSSSLKLNNHSRPVQRTFLSPEVWTLGLLLPVEDVERIAV